MAFPQSYLDSLLRSNDSGLTRAAVWPLLLSIACSVGLAATGWDRTAWGQEMTAQVPPLLALPAERLLIEQAGELIQAGQIDEALRLLEKLLDEADNRLIAAAPPQMAASLKTQLYVPLAQWAARRTTTALENFPEAAAKAAARQREPAKLALAHLQETKDLRSALLAVRRFSAPALGTNFQLLLSDLYLERGWGVAASQAIAPAASGSRIRAQPESRAADGKAMASGSLAASLVWHQLTAGKSADEQERVWQGVFARRYLPSPPGLPPAALPEAGEAPATTPAAANTATATTPLPITPSSGTPSSGTPSTGTPSTGIAAAIAAQNASQVVRRLAIAAAMNSESLDAPAVLGWAERMAQHIGGSTGQDLQSALEQIAHWRQLAPPLASLDSFHGPELYHEAMPSEAALADSMPSDSNPSPSIEQRTAPAEASHAQVNLHAPLSFATWPKWSHALERFSVTNDLTSAHGVPVAESSRATLPYYPAVHNGVVFVNGMTRIVAYDLKTGAPWPQGSGGLPLFESELSAASYLPLGYPMVGSPRGTLNIANGCLYARMGSPVTGRLVGRAASSGRSDASLSYLVGLDLSKQGSMLPGFPLHLSAADFAEDQFPAAQFTAAEFDGPPLAWGDLLIVAVAQRDHVGLRRSLAAFDRITGELRWKSGVLASGSIPDTQRANLIAHQQLTLAGGRLYYNTHLGSIACLDPLNGQTQWLVQYSVPRVNSSFPKPNRYRYRDLTPCLLSAGLVFCAPQDAPEIFALDAITGELVWSTDQSSVADGVQLLGTVGDALIVSGDRLVWLDKRTGTVTASFPGSTTPIVGGALPSPRGLGRGFISGQHVYWPTAAEIFVFSTQLPSGSSAAGGIPAIAGRIPVRPSGSEGVNVLVIDRTLLVASPSRLMAFDAD